MHPPLPDRPDPDGGARGRRGNGLDAAEWGALVDVDPRLSAPLLERLASEGVAAQVEPAGATTDPASRAGAFPPRPLDRLWVDVGRADRAREVVEAQAAELVSAVEQGGAPEQFLHAVPREASGRVLRPPQLPVPSAAAVSPAGVDEDAAWQAIVEGFRRSPDDPVPPWPVQEDLRQGEDPGPDRRPDEVPPDAPRRRRRGDAEAGLPGWVEPAALADDGRYVPPPPPPTPRVQPRTLAAAAAVVLGVLMLFTPTTFDIAPGAGSFLLGALLTGGGVAALVLGMRDAPSADDGPDDGAVV